MIRSQRVSVEVLLDMVPLAALKSNPIMESHSFCFVQGALAGEVSLDREPLVVLCRKMQNPEYRTKSCMHGVAQGGLSWRYSWTWYPWRREPI